MEKGIDLQAKLHIGTDPGALSALRQSLPDLFARTNPGLTLRIKKVSEPDSAGDATLRVYIEGDQDPAADFAALTRSALDKALAAYNSGGDSAGGTTSGSAHSAASMGEAPAGQPRVHLKDLKEMEGDEEDTDVTLAPQAHSQASSQPPSAASSTATGDAAPASPAAAPSQPPASAQPAAAPSSPTSSTPPTPSTAPAAGRPWWAFWRRTN